MIRIITGQTATGKTKHALELAEQYDGELINCDSRQIYKKLDIITGKDLDSTTKEFHKTYSKENFDTGYYEVSLPTSNDQRPTTKVWLYDVVDPKYPFSSHDYRTLVIPIIEDILSRKKTPIIVGGTYFYLKNLLYDIQDIYIPPDWDLRKSLKKSSIEELQKKLKEKAPDVYTSLNNSEKHNPQRLIRRIEIASTGAVSGTQEAHKVYQFSDLFEKNETKITGFTFKDQNVIPSRIRERVMQRLQNGALNEVTKLMQQGYSQHDPGMKTIGYIQCIKHQLHQLSESQMIDEWVNKEVQYAKRQLTFMKQDQNINWIAV